MPPPPRKWRPKRFPIDGRNLPEGRKKRQKVCERVRSQVTKLRRELRAQSTEERQRALALSNGRHEFEFVPPRTGLERRMRIDALKFILNSKRQTKQLLLNTIAEVEKCRYETSAERLKEGISQSDALESDVSFEDVSRAKSMKASEQARILGESSAKLQACKVELRAQRGALLKTLCQDLEASDASKKADLQTCRSILVDNFRKAVEQKLLDSGGSSKANLKNLD
eukprot:CAMPEP_0113846556 /NCGR_PEP_ID=MMETSP0372-20130328/1373_1 /TAXON_ID=340204 /ORGANISM="Lankesteria abbotti" /LENGTH=225 /DNA_ID=CAMNT_0000815713 /DNA_START=29 /DNA_END=706 /DNA_ORIENTATION=+ /assembly_acc=CAM_ASM_000359